MAISKSTSTSPRTSAGMKRPRAVRFNNTVKHVLDNRRDAEQVRCTWYNKAELGAIKTDIKSDLQMYFAGKLTETETNTISFRGLELYTKRTKFQKHRRERRTFLSNGVQDLQRRLKAEGLSSEKAISKLVTIASKSANHEAQTQAQQDSLEANQIYLDTFLCPVGDDKFNELPAVVAPHHDSLTSHQQLVTARTA